MTRAALTTDRSNHDWLAILHIVITTLNEIETVLKQRLNEKTYNFIMIQIWDVRVSRRLKYLVQNGLMSVNRGYLMVIGKLLVKHLNLYKK